MASWMRKKALFVLLCGTGLFGGCGPRRLHNIPAGFAVVQEHIIYAPHNIPPIRNDIDFTIIEVDGAAFTRETPPFLVDMQPGVLVSAGTHHFRAKTMPHLHKIGDQPTEVTFDATVEGGKAYFLVNKDKLPVLVEEHLTR
jgi:hypothetical protein